MVPDHSVSPGPGGWFVGVNGRDFGPYPTELEALLAADRRVGWGARALDRHRASVLNVDVAAIQRLS